MSVDKIVHRAESVNKSPLKMGSGTVDRNGKISPTKEVHRLVNIGCQVDAD